MNHRLSNIFFIIIILLLFFDLGNLDAIRQGTEGFYLLISQEMYEADKLLTPIIYGQNHWSKPPLQFWLPMPFYKVFGGSYLYWARFSILLCSLLGAFFISQWYEKELKRNWIEGFSVLILPIYFIKYSRIFMMEMCLTYLSTLGLLYSYSYIFKKKTIFSGAILSGLSVLIKGPVSLLMVFPTPLLLSLQKKEYLRRTVLYFALSIGIGSIWFILSFLEYGNDFFEYFFIRENLGKFKSKNYPIKSVIQGLVIFSLPISLLTPFLVKPFYFHFKKVIKNHTFLFLLSSFCFFYFLWFLPKQKSHHYAVPSIPLFLIIITYSSHELFPYLRKKFHLILNLFSYFLIFAGSLLFFGYLYFYDGLNTQGVDKVFGIFFIFSCWSFLNKRKFYKTQIIKHLLPIILIWVFILPMGILPLVPNKAKDLLLSTKESSIFVHYRKPFFVAEALEKEITILDSSLLKDTRVRSNDFIFIHENLIENNFAYSDPVCWKVWKRGNGLSQITQAIINRSLNALQEKYCIIQKL